MVDSSATAVHCFSGEQPNDMRLTRLSLVTRIDFTAAVMFSNYRRLNHSESRIWANRQNDEMSQASVSLLRGSLSAKDENGYLMQKNKKNSSIFICCFESFK